MGDMTGKAAVSLRKIFCTDLPAVMKEIPDANFSSGLCEKIRRGRIEDKATLVLTPANNESVQFNYKGPYNSGVFQVRRSGQVYDWGLKPKLVQELGNKAGEILFRGMAVHSLFHLATDRYTADPVLESAVAYLRCRTWNRSPCDLPRKQLQSTIQLKRWRDAPRVQIDIDMDVLHRACCGGL